MAFIDEISTRLVSEGVGSTNSNILWGSGSVVPVGNGPYLSLVETGGYGSMKTQNGIAIERPTMLLLARAKHSADARLMLKNAYNALGGANGLFNITLSGVFYLSLKARSIPADTGKDAANRVMFSFNIDCEKYPS